MNNENRNKTIELTDEQVEKVTGGGTAFPEQINTYETRLLEYPQLLESQFGEQDPGVNSGEQDPGSPLTPVEKYYKALEDNIKNKDWFLKNVPTV